MSIQNEARQARRSEETSVSHVPGPWSVGHVRPQGVHKSLQPMYEAPIHVGEGATRGNCHTIVYGGGPGAGSSSEEDIRANARLIAAAPELLQSVRELAGWLLESQQPFPRIYLERAHAVIAKVEGTK